MQKKLTGCLLFMSAAVLGLYNPTEVQAADGMAGRKNFNGHSYALFNDSMLWTQAKAACEQMGGHLVTITSQGEQDFIKELADEQGTKYYFWLGGTDEEQEGTWKWITGETWDYEYWEDGQPNNDKAHDAEHGQDYLLAHHVPDTEFYDMRWEDQPNDGTSGDSYYYNPPYCQRTEYYGYICEWETQADIGSLKITDAVVKLSQTKYAYTGDEFQPGVTVTYDGRRLKKDTDYTLTYSNNTEIGKGTVTVKGIGNYTGSQRKTFTITPANVKNFKVRSAARGKADLSWKRVAKASGYQIQYSVRKNFYGKSIRTIKNGTATKTRISSLLKGKTYYFRVRSYTDVNGVLYYGGWSVTRQLKVK